MKKTCTICKVPKELKEFHVNRITYDKLCAQCKSCKNAMNKKYIKSDWMKTVIG